MYLICLLSLNFKNFSLLNKNNFFYKNTTEKVLRCVRLGMAPLYRKYHTDVTRHSLYYNNDLYAFISLQVELGLYAFIILSIKILW